MEATGSGRPVVEVSLRLVRPRDDSDPQAMAGAPSCAVQDVFPE